MMEKEEEVPCYFLCPISLQMMREPVTLPTGITYDRECIERWLLTAGTCPLTKQAVAADCELTPNHTLRRLIQAWCAAHHQDQDQAADINSIPKKIDRARVTSLLSQIQEESRRRTGGPHRYENDDEVLAEAVRELRDVAAESDRSRELIATVPGAVDTLISVFVTVASSSSSSSSSSGSGREDSNNKAAGGAVEEALLEILCSLIQQHSGARVVVQTTTNGGDQLVDALVSSLQRSTTSSSRSREHSARLLADVTAAMSPNRLASLPEPVFREAVHLLRDNHNLPKPATKAALRVLVGATSWGRNRIKAVDAGAVAVLLDMLLLVEKCERRVCELALAALDRLCGCAEGRAELVAHAAGIAVVGNRALLRVSDVAADKAVRILRSVARHAATPPVLQEMAHTGVVAALCLVAAQSSEQHLYAERTRERARETLRLHARTWKNSPCLHRHIQAIYSSIVT